MKKALSLLLTLVMVLSLAACGGKESDTSAPPAEGDSSTSAPPVESGDVANKDKPLVWFNRQPSNSSTGELDMTALSFNEYT